MFNKEFFTERSGSAQLKAYETMVERMPAYLKVDDKDHVLTGLLNEGSRICNALGAEVQYLGTLTVTDEEMIFKSNRPETDAKICEIFEKEHAMTAELTDSGTVVKFTEAPELDAKLIGEDVNTHRLGAAFVAAIFETMGCTINW